LFLLKALFAQTTQLIVSRSGLKFQMPHSHVEKVQAFKAEEEEKLERQFLKGTKDEELGVYCDLFSAKSSIEGQDGGVVTALLQKGFREGLFDVAIVVRRIKGYNAEAIVVEKLEDFSSTTGTTYLKVNMTKKLRELSSQGKKRIAIVCTPCEVKAARKIQQTIGKDCEVTVIGLFCFEAFNHSKLREAVKKQLGVDIEKVGKTQVKNGRFIAWANGQEISCNVKDFDGACEVACRFCDDFTSRLADVSVGSVGSKQGYSTVIIRSPTGEQLVKNNDFIKDNADKQEIVRLSKFKRKRAKKNYSEIEH
jgi:coenzyme F420-reducing hydrogenase beta subunit